MQDCIIQIGKTKPASCGLLLCGLAVEQVQRELTFFRLKPVNQEFIQLIAGQPAGAQGMRKLRVKHECVTAFNFRTGAV